MGRVPIRPANQAREKRCLSQSQIAQVLVEINLCCLREAVDGEGTALSEVHIIAIEREYLLLREPRFQDNRHRRLFELSTQGPVGSEKVVLDELLRKRRPALNEFTVIQVRFQRPKDSAPAHSIMTEEAVVLRRNDCITQIVRYV